MLLIALLLFCKVLDNMDLKKLHEDAELPAKIMDDLLHAEESLKDGKIFEANAATPAEESGNLPPLVPFEFPPDFYEKQGRKIVEAVENKMGKFFGNAETNKLKDFDSAEGMLDYLSNMDFNNTLINFIVQKCMTYLKPTDTVPLEGITDKKACKHACRKNLSTPVAFVHRVFQNFITQATDEDLRFRIFQDPKKCYEYSFDREKKNEHYCKCVDKGYQVKVSPRLLEIINRKLDNIEGLGLAEQIEKDDSTENLASLGNFFSLRKMGNLALYFSGFSSSTKSRWGGGGYGNYGNNYYPKKDPAEFITTHLIINILLFIFCHCLWYFHIVYFVLVFLTEYVL